MSKNTGTITKAEFNGIDLVKFVMSIVVVAIHTHPLENVSSPLLNGIYSVVTGMAVPVFFLATGFLLAVKLEYPYDSEKSMTAIKLYLIKTIKMYLFWTVIYLPLAVYGFVLDGTPFLKACFLYVRGVLLVGENYNSWMLWYLLSVIYTLAMIMLMLKFHVSPKIIVAVGFAITAIGFGLDQLVGHSDLPGILSLVSKAVRVTILNGRLLRGVFYIATGMLLAHIKLPVRWSWALLIVGFAADLFTDSSFVSSFLIMLHSVGLFGIVCSLRLSSSPLYPTLRKMSTVIYFIHLYVWTFYYLIAHSEKHYGMDSFLVTVIICIAVALMYVKRHEFERLIDTRN